MSLQKEPVEIFQSIFEWIGNGFSILYFISPLFQIIRMYKKKLSPEAFPILLVLTILFNCLFWIIFAVQSPIWISMLITNGIGLLVNIVLLFLYLYIFLQKKIKPFVGYGLFVVNLLGEVFYIMWSLVPHQRTNENVGFVAMIINMIMYASPIQNIVSLFRTGKYEFLPILTNVIGFFATLLWLFYGVLTRDTRTLLSNGLSFIIVTLQIVFWAYFFIRAIKPFLNKNKALANEDIKIDIRKVENNHIEDGRESEEVKSQEQPLIKEE